MKKLILVTLVLCMALSACTKAEVGKAPTAESAAASSVESTASGGKSAASEVSLPEKTKTAAHVTKTLSSGVEVDADVLIPASMQKIRTAGNVWKRTYNRSGFSSIGLF